MNLSPDIDACQCGLGLAVDKERNILYDIPFIKER